LNDRPQSGFVLPSAAGIPLALQPSAQRIRFGPADDILKKGFAEKAFVVCVLVLSTTAFVNLLPGESGIEYEEQGKLFAQILWLFLYLVMLLYVRKRVWELLRVIWQNKALVALLAWACVSVVWSIDRPVTIRHFGALLLSSFFGVYLAFRFSLREQLRLVSVALWIIIIASTAACLFFPSYGIRTEESTTGPAWQGVLSDKNGLARLAVLAALILALYFVNRLRRPAVLIGIALLFFLVILTQAKTALVYFILGMLAFPFVRAIQNNPVNRRKIIAVALLIFGGLAAWTYYNWENFTYYLGKDPNLTGRVALWGISMTWIADKPFLGYGFEGFWSNYYGPAADLRIAVGWLEAPHAHNGFINLWLDLGLIGVLLFVLGFIITYREATAFATTTKSVEGIWPVTFLTFYMVYSFTETNFLSRNDLLWILYVAMMFCVRTDKLPAVGTSEAA
jgi:O-antigen ligase